MLVVLGAAVLNIMPLLPTAGTPFAAVPEPDRKVVQMARAIASRYLPKMTHCSRCRADAVGLIGEENRQRDIDLLQIAARPAKAPSGPSTPTLQNIDSHPSREALSELRIIPTQERPYVAVASRDDVRINRHLGEATEVREPVMLLLKRS
jgi:nitrogen fixation protein NifB